jgi:membrane-associated phospholipid phosphatase
MRFVLAGLGLILVWAAMLAFGGGGPLDRDVLLALHAGAHPALVRAAWIVTQFGDEAVLLPVTALVALLLIVRRERRAAVLLLLVTLSGRLLVELQKGWTARPRPEAELHLVGTQTWSFPSGHAANATIVALALALLLVRDPRRRLPALIAAALLAFLVGLSRVMLGVHWPSDVVAGWAFGLLGTVLLLRLKSPSAL